VHARSVVACAIDGVTGEVIRTRLCPDHGEIRRCLATLADPVAVAYEAGPTGFGLARALAAIKAIAEAAHQDEQLDGQAE